MTRGRWQLKHLHSEPTSRLRENKNKEKKLFLKLLYNLDLKFLITYRHSKKQPQKCVPWE